MEVGTQGAPSLLVVDDDPRNRLAMAALLEPLGFRVVLASSGEEAITLARCERFGVILVDVRMPGLDGFETVARLREDPNAKRVPIVLLSAFGSESDYARKAYAVGAVDFISKPVDPDLLRAKVASLAEVGRSESADVPGHQAVAAYFRSERASLLKDRLVGIIGHDLRNPLTSISMTAYALLGSKDQPERVAAMAQRILRTAERMGEMVRVILDFTRGELGTGIAVVRQPAEMGGICRAIVEEVEGAHPDRRIRVQLSGDLDGHWDSDRCMQAVSNLVGNAIAHSSTDVDVIVDGTDVECVRVSVHNGGEPIPADELPTLFEPFRRGSKVTNGQGLGLGLYITREIVTAHGGRIEARSSPAEGTTFMAVFPRSSTKATVVTGQ
jgi:signal transduction histidine kinase